MNQPVPPRVKLTLRNEPLPLKSPFRIFGYVFEDMPATIVTLNDGTHEGRGEAAGVYYLDDTTDKMLATLEGMRGIIEAGITRQTLLDLLPPGGARNALDCALWELEARRAGVPVWKLAGLSETRPLLTTFTVGANDPAAMAASAVAYTQARAIKMKLTGDADLDSERVRAVRAARPDVWLGVDANQGYTRETLPDLLPALVDSHVLLLEQPCKRGDESELDGFDCPIALAADESVLSLAEMDAMNGRWDVVNIKLDKCGGLTEGLLMAKKAQDMKLRVMVGNMCGTSWAAAAGFVLGQHCDVVDLDGPTFLKKDRSPAVVYSDGHITSPDNVWGGPTA